VPPSPPPLRDNLFGMPSPTWEQIETIFLSAVDLPAGDQAAFLDRACQGDRDLRLEVESLLDSDRKSGEKITRAVEDEAQSLFGLSPIIDSRLGAWRVVREIGRGGMGAVYLATRDDDQFQKKVAIKLVKRGMDTAEVQRRFQHERQILAGLDHPYIARLIDAGTAPDGRSFFVMEYVEGQSIDAYCHDHSLWFADRCRLFLKVCEAVAHAHRNLVVHRDLKPGNIFVTPDGTPKLLDFGVAKLIAPDADPQLTVTGMRTALLTPQYASPEQVMGRPVNTSSDVYSLGAVLYELLTGACAQHLDSTSPEEIERVICLREVPPPSSVTPGLPRDLDNIVMMAMRKDPDRRYSSVDQFAADIQRYLDGRPVLARKDSLAYRTGKFVRRNRLMIAAAALVAASLVGGIFIAVSQARRAQRRLTEMVELANRSLFDVHSAIERLPGAMDARREIVKTTLAYLESLSKDAGQDDDLRLSMATAYWRLGDIQGYADKPNLGDLKGALASFTRSAELLQPLRLKRPRDSVVVMQVVDTYQHMARVQEALGDVPAAERAFENSLPEAKLIAALKPDDVESNQALGVFLNDLAMAIQFADPQRANEYARQHLALIPGLLKKFPASDDIADEAAVAHATMSNLLHRAGDREQALREALESASIREGVSSRHPNDVFRRRLLLIAYGHVGDQYGAPPVMHPGDPELSKQYFDKCVSIARGIVQTDPQDRTARYDLANSLLRWGNISLPGVDPAPSLAALRESAAILESLVEENPQAIRYRTPLALAYQYTGLCLRDMGRAEEAIVELRRSVTLADAMMAAHPGDINFLARIARGERLIAEILVARHDPAAALPHAQRALSIAEKYAAGPEAQLRKKYLADAHFGVAEVHRALGRWPEAQDHARRADSLWSAPEVRDVDPKLRQQAAAILTQSAVHLSLSEPNRKFLIPAK
jgi:serine/threonine protein kinase/tetratricopeptide (TPR) repeat protein